MSSLPNILELIEQLEQDDPPPDRRTVPEFVTVQSGDRLKIVPADSRGFLYRGQNKKWPICVPSVLRGDPGKDTADMRLRDTFRARYVLSRIQIAQVELLLREHPFTRLADKHRLAVHYDSLAQHYEIPTDWLDLTSAIRTAGFFAVAKKSPDGLSWTPTEEERGVIYRVHHRQVHDFPSYFMSVGHGPAGRPGRQHAYGVHVARGVNFAAYPFVETREFRHDEAASREVVAQYDGGKKLYPSDCIADLVGMVRDIRTLTFGAIRHSLTRDGCPAAELEQRVEANAQFVSSALTLDVVEGARWELEATNIARAEREAEEAEKTLFNGVGVQLVRERKPDASTVP